MKVHFKIKGVWYVSTDNHHLQMPYILEEVGHTLGDPGSMSLNASNHKEQQYI